MRQAILYQGEDGWWVAEVPSLPGCVSQGRTREEAVRNITEAAELWLESAAANGDTIPLEQRPPEVVPLSNLRRSA